MRDVIIASKNPRAAERVRSVLQSAQIFSNCICASGAEVLQYASIRPDAVVVCGKLSDNMPPVRLAKLLPNGFDVVWLLHSGESPSGFCGNLVPLFSPIGRAQLCDTVRMLAATGAETVRPRRERKEEEESLLREAKVRLMERHAVSEREAHRLLQRRSMESGMKLTEVARLVLDE